MSEEIYVIGDSTTEMTIGFAQSKIKAQQERIQELEKAFSAAKAYIDECPCDPDIYPEQLNAWSEYQSVLQLLASKGEGE